MALPSDCSCHGKTSVTRKAVAEFTSPTKEIATPRTRFGNSSENNTHMTGPSDTAKLDEIRLPDAVLYAADVDRLVQAMAAFDAPLATDAKGPLPGVTVYKDAAERLEAAKKMLRELAADAPAVPFVAFRAVVLEDRTGAQLRLAVAQREGVLDVGGSQLSHRAGGAVLPLEVIRVDRLWCAVLRIVFRPSQHGPSRPPRLPAARPTRRRGPPAHLGLHRCETRGRRSRHAGRRVGCRGESLADRGERTRSASDRGGYAALHTCLQ